MENQTKLKDFILSKYKSINDFVDQNYLNIGISRTYLYQLIQGKKTNPTVDIIKSLSNTLNLPSETVYNMFDYKDEKSNADGE